MNRKQAADLLECSPHATLDQIKAAYRKKIKTVHPDVTDKDASTAMDVNLARETLESHSSLSNFKQKLRVARIPVEKKDFNGLYPISGWCKECNNHSGFVFPTEGQFCKLCNGRGCVDPRRAKTIPCNICIGSGFVLTDDHRCKNCVSGSKFVLLNVKYTVDPDAKSGDVVYEIEKPEYGYEKLIFTIK